MIKNLCFVAVLGIAVALAIQVGILRTEIDRQDAQFAALIDNTNATRAILYSEIDTLVVELNMVEDTTNKTIQDLTIENEQLRQELWLERHALPSPKN